MAFLRRYLRARFGWLPLYELRNKVRLGHTAIGLRRFELAEARRLARELPGGRLPTALVATILLTYKRPDDLLRAVESALAQTVTDHVVLVVDDGGGLPELPQHPRLHAVSISRNINVLGVSRNIGMRLTDSQFVAFLDDDNYWYPHHLETALAQLRRKAPQPRPDAVYTAMRRVLPDGEEYDVLSVSFDRKAAMNETFLDCNPFVARRLPALSFSRLRRSSSVAPKEDWELIFRLSRRHRVEHVPEVTLDYLVNPKSYWTRWDSEPVTSAGDAERL
jgi:glycosyltransferase involved in cell wall biosynthesis